MTLTLITLGGLSVIEQLLWLSVLSSLRKALASILMIAIMLASGWLVGNHWAFWTVLIAIISLYRAINLLRLIEGRMVLGHILSLARRTSWWLIGMQAIVAGLAGISYHYAIGGLAWLSLAAGFSVLAALLIARWTWQHIQRTRPHAPTKHWAEAKLPTLTVAIPARNETVDLEQCLQSLIASTYPKLEILVLDDCSQNKHTPEIIKGFAHAGVRFIAGEAPPEHWLAKNYGYHQLAEEANGELLLFCGVDVRFEPESLTVIIETLLQRKKLMLSIIPRNLQPKVADLEGVLIQPSRYAWELALPRRWLRRPPVLSTCWLINTDLLQSAGGFKAVANSVSPESYLARQAVQEHDSYSFLQSADVFGVTSAKSAAEQRATAIRTRYPQIHRRPELVLAVSMTELGVFITPLVTLVAGLLTHSNLLLAISCFTFLILLAFYIKIVTLTYQTFLLRSVWLVVAAVIYDVCLLNYSMWRYEFREVIWKGRNVCLPVLNTQAPR